MILDALHMYSIFFVSNYTPTPSSTFILAQKNLNVNV